MIPRQARNDGGWALLSFHYIIYIALAFSQFLTKTRKCVFCHFSRHFDQRDRAVPHHFDRSAVTREAEKSGRSRTKHSLDFYRVWVLTVYCVCTRINVLHLRDIRNGLSSLRRFALIPWQARNDGGVSNYHTTLRRFAWIPRQARNDGGVSNYRTTLRRFAWIPRQARNDGGVSNAASLCGGSPGFLDRLGMMGYL